MKIIYLEARIWAFRLFPGVCLTPRTQIYEGPLVFTLIEHQEAFLYILANVIVYLINSQAAI